MAGPKRPHVIVFTALGLAAALIAAYAAAPLAWQHYEHHKGLVGRSMVTHTKQGIPGDPINFGVVGSPADVVCVFNAAGWGAATPVTLRSSLAIVGSVALRRPYPRAPVSALFYNDRKEDLAFELADGASANRRHHVRLWRVTGDGSDPARPLWLGADSFDKGVGVSRYTWRVTHHIDPDLDTEREFLAAALVRTGHVYNDYQVSGVGPTVQGHNGGGDAYFTDGEVEIEQLTAGCAAPPAAPATTHFESPWPVQLRTFVWRLVRPLNRLSEGDQAN